MTRGKLREAIAAAYSAAKDAETKKLRLFEEVEDMDLGKERTEKICDMIGWYLSVRIEKAKVVPAFEDIDIEDVLDAVFGEDA